MLYEKLGKGMKKFKIKFQYIDTKSTAIKYVYADTAEEAKKVFDDYYKNYKVKIKEISLENSDLKKEDLWKKLETKDKELGDYVMTHKNVLEDSYAQKLREEVQELYDKINSYEKDQKKEKLIRELLKIQDTGKSKIIKKYNLSLNDIHTIKDLIKGKYKDFIQMNVAILLKDYEYDVVKFGGGFLLNE